MTNDVRILRNKYALPPSLDRESQIRKAIIMGDKERAKQIIIDEFLTKAASCETTNVAEFKKLKDKLAANLHKIGAEMPEIITKMNTAYDFNNLY